MMKKLILCAAASTLLATSVITQAEDGPFDNAIKARQAMFQLYGFNIGILSAMAKEKIPYDADIAAEAAGNLSAAVNLGQSQFWPQGSDSEGDGNATTRALPKIWDNLSDVVEKREALSAAVAGLDAVAGNGLDALQGSLGDVGAACKSCHDNYRAEKK